MQSLKTDRLELREFEPEDSRQLFELYGLEETSRYESWTPHTSIDETRSLLDYWLSRRDDKPRTDYTLAIDLEGEFIGLIGLELGFGTETDDLRAGFVGYRLHPSRWGNGYATESGKKILKFGFEDLKLHRIHSGCVVSNVASIKVLEKSGFVQEGRTRASFPIDDTWHDYLLFGVLNSEWPRAR